MTEVRTLTESDDISHVAIVGRLDIDGVSRIELPLTAATVARKRPVIIDMSNVEFLGSIGIGLLVRCAVSLNRSGAKLVLFGCQPLVRKTLEISKVSSVMPIADSRTEALTAASGG